MRDDDVPCCKPEFWIYLVTCITLVLAAGITSGLALGLLSFSQVDLEVLIKAGLPHDRKNAARILPLVQNEHLLLCTLLIVKAIALEALPIFVDSSFPFWLAILASATLVVAFSEILPQAVCSRHGLSLGAKLSILVRFLLLIFYPLAYPCSKLLDLLLGKAHSALLRRAELKTLVDLHSNEAGKGGDLSTHETTIISGALDLTQKTAKDAMTPISESFCLDIHSRLNMHTMGLIRSKGHSRIPIYSGNPKNVIGLILVKNLIFCRLEDETPVKHMTIRKIPRIHEDFPLYGVLKEFQKGHSHMALVVKHIKKDVKINIEEENPASLDFVTDLHSKPTLVERKEMHLPFDQSEQLNISTNTSPLYHADMEIQSPACEGVIDQQKELHPHGKTWEEKAANIASEDLEILATKLDEEVIGIITMEDVIEELLQEDILDETDAYVDLHNKIRINLPQGRRSTSKSPQSISVPRFRWTNPEQQPPVSADSSMFYTPMSSYIRSPRMRPTSSASPRKSNLNLQV